MSLRNVIFAKAGTFEDNDGVFLSSRTRQNNRNYTIYHRNNYTTEIIIPPNVFKANFVFDRSAGIYRNNLTYGQLKALPGVKITVGYDPC